MNTTAPAKPTADIAEIKRAAAGRWPEIVPALTIIPAEVLDGRHHPCPKCGGTDRFRALDDFSQTGAVLCNQCFSQDNGDGIAALQHFADVDFPTAIRLLADQLGLSGANGNGKAHTTNGRAKQQPKKAADVATLLKGIEINDSPQIYETLAGMYSKAKPPITPEGIRQCGGKLVRWYGNCCIQLDGRAAIDEPNSLRRLCSCELRGHRSPQSARSGNARHTPLRGPSIRGLLRVTWPPRKPSSTWKVSPTCWPWHRPDFLPVGLRSRTPPVPRPGANCRARGPTARRLSWRETPTTQGSKASVDPQRHITRPAPRPY